MSSRVAVREETLGALEELERNLGPNTLLAPPTVTAAMAIVEETRRALARDGVRLALVGERHTYAWLDAYLSAPVFDGARAGADLVIVVRDGEPGLVAQRRDGTSERLALEADGDLRAQVGALQRSLAEMPAESAIAVEGFWPRVIARVLGWWRGLFRRNRPSDPRDRVRAELARLEELERHRKQAFVGRVHEMIAASSDIVQLELSWPMGGESVVLYDLRGALARVRNEAWALIRGEMDACILDLDGASMDTIGPATQQLARELTKIGPHVWVASTDSTERVGRTLGVDPARIACLAPPLRREALTERALSQRALMAAMRTNAALRLAQQGIEEIEQHEEERDREAIGRIALQRIATGNKRRDETRRKVKGAVAGRAVRIMETVLSSLGAELAVLREERGRAIAAARSKDEVRAEVSVVGPALRAIRAKLANHAETAMHEAMSQLGPTLLAEFERCVALVNEALHEPRNDAPSWPAAPKVTALDENALVAHVTLASGETLRADIGWTDSFRSLASIKQRCAQELDRALEQLANAAQTEVLDFEPRLASRIEQALEEWLEAAAEVYTAWLDAALRDEQRYRDRTRGERLAGAVAVREALNARAQRVAAAARRLATG